MSFLLMHQLRWSLASMTMVLLAGCARPQHYQEVMQEQRSAWKEMADILATVQDKASMDRAKIELDQRQEHFESIARKMKALPKPSEQIRERLEQEQFVMQRAFARLQDEIRRVHALPGGDAFFQQFPSGEQDLLQAVQR